MLAIWVVLHHLTGRGMLLDVWVRTLPVAVEGIIRRGYLAVGTFFVLSGFVLALTYTGTSWTRGSLSRYGLARFARVYPVYILSLLIVAPFIVAERLPLVGGGFLHNKAGLLADYLLLLLGWTGALPVNWNTPAWSLSCEAFFYLCFPLLAVFVPMTTWRHMLATSAAACVLPSALLAAGIPDMWKPLVHVSDFLIGMAAARAYLLLLERRRPPSGWWLYLPCLAVSAVLIGYPELLPAAVPLGSVLRPLNAAVLTGLALGGGLLAGALSTRLSVYLGKASYSVYILHVPLLWWFKRTAHHWLGPLAAVPSACVYVAGVILASAAVFRFIEEPANRCLRNWLRARA